MAVEATQQRSLAYIKALALSTCLGRLMYLEMEFNAINKVYGKDSQISPHMADCLKETIRDLTTVKDELLKEREGE